MRGQALFEVTHNAARPLIVKAGKGEIRALGTAFDVDLTRREVIVNVTKGVVRVTAPRVGSGEAQSATHEVGQQLSYSDLGLDRKRVVWGKSVSVRVACGGRRIIKKQKQT